MGPPLLDGERLAEEVGDVGDGGAPVGDLPVEHRDLVVGRRPVVEHEVVAPEVAVADGERRLGHAGEDEPLELVLACGRRCRASRR